MFIQTEISVDHYELIKIFFQANELKETIIHQKPFNIRGVDHQMISIHILDDDSAVQITFMGIIHSGILNMLDDYLIKCGVSPDEIKPKSYYRQIKDEKEARIIAEFEENLQKQIKEGKLKELYEHSNKR